MSDVSPNAATAAKSLPSKLSKTVLRILTRLSLPGAYIETVARTGAGVRLIVPGKPSLSLPLGLVDPAIAAGFLASSGDATRLTLSVAGRALLATAKQSEPGDGRSRRKAPSPTHRDGRNPRRGGEPQTLLAWYNHRRDRDGRTMITGAQRDAGERLANDFTLAGMMPRVTANWSAIAPDRNTRRAAPGAGVEISERAADAQRRVQTALLTVGVEFAGLLIDVCCLETGLEVLEVRERWPQRSAKLLLQVALTRLARHYGIIPPPREPLARLRHWAAGDFQPNLAAWREPAAPD